MQQITLNYSFPNALLLHIVKIYRTFESIRLSASSIVNYHTVCQATLRHFQIVTPSTFMLQLFYQSIYELVKHLYYKIITIYIFKLNN